MRTAGPFPTLILAALGLPGCLEAAEVVCADGSRCAGGLVCVQGGAGGCADPQDVAGCETAAAGAPCGEGDQGVCIDGRCERPGCGNGLVEPGRGETCDDGNVAPGDGCAATCTSDETCGNGVTDYSEGEICDCGTDPAALPPGCAAPNGDEVGASCFTTCQPHGCGDGLREGLEQCEGADLQDLGCTDVGFYGGALTCDAACRFDTSACVGSCGDGVINGPEFCEDVVPGSCVLYGLDYGRPDCNALCGISLAPCGSLAEPTVVQAPHGDAPLTTAWSDGTAAFVGGRQYAVCTGICQPYRAWLRLDDAGWHDETAPETGMLGLTGASATSLFAVLDDPAGQVFIGQKAIAIVDGTPTTIEMPPIAARPRSIHSRQVDEFVFGTDSGELGRWSGGVTEVWSTRPSGTWINAVLATADGALIANPEGEGWIRVDAAGTVTPLALPLGRGTAVFSDAGGDYLGDATGRVVRLDGDSGTVVAQADDAIDQILRDVDGALLLVSSNLLLRADGDLTTVVAAGGVTSAFVVDGVLHVAVGNTIRALPWPRIERTLLLPPVRATALDDDGSLWSVDGTTVRRGDLAVLPGIVDPTGVATGGGVMAIASGKGVWRRSGATWTNLGPDQAALPPGGRPTAVWVAPDGVVFAASGLTLLRWDGAWTEFPLTAGPAPRTDAVGLTGSSSTDVYVSVRVDLVPTDRHTVRFDGAAITPFFVPYAGTLFQEQAYQLLALAPDDVYASWAGETQHFDGADWTVAWPEATGGLAVDPAGTLWGIVDGRLGARDAVGWLPIRGDLQPAGAPVTAGAAAVYVPSTGGAALTIWRR